MMDSPDSKSRDLRVAQLIERGFAAHPLVGRRAAQGPSAGAPAPAACRSTARSGGGPAVQFAIPAATR